MKKKEVEKYLYVNLDKRFPKYALKIGGLELYFNTIKEAEEYYQVYLK